MHLVTMAICILTIALSSVGLNSLLQNNRTATSVKGQESIENGFPVEKARFGSCIGIAIIVMTIMTWALITEQTSCGSKKRLILWGRSVFSWAFLTLSIGCLFTTLITVIQMFREYTFTDLDEKAKFEYFAKWAIGILSATTVAVVALLTNKTKVIPMLKNKHAARQKRNSSKTRNDLFEQYIKAGSPQEQGQIENAILKLCQKEETCDDDLNELDKRLNNIVSSLNNKKPLTSTEAVEARKALFKRNTDIRRFTTRLKSKDLNPHSAEYDLIDLDLTTEERKKIETQLGTNIDTIIETAKDKQDQKNQRNLKKGEQIFEKGVKQQKNRASQKLYELMNSHSTYNEKNVDFLNRLIAGDEFGDVDGELQTFEGARVGFKRNISHHLEGEIVPTVGYIPSIDYVLQLSEVETELHQLMYESAFRQKESSIFLKIPYELGSGVNDKEDMHVIYKMNYVKGSMYKFDLKRVNTLGKPQDIEGKVLNPIDIDKGHFQALIKLHGEKGEDTTTTHLSTLLNAPEYDPPKDSFVVLRRLKPNLKQYNGMMAFVTARIPKEQTNLTVNAFIAYIPFYDIEIVIEPKMATVVQWNDKMLGLIPTDIIRPGGKRVDLIKAKENYIKILYSKLLLKRDHEDALKRATDLQSVKRVEPRAAEKSTFDQIRPYQAIVGMSFAAAGAAYATMDPWSAAAAGGVGWLVGKAGGSRQLQLDPEIPDFAANWQSGFGAKSWKSKFHEPPPVTKRQSRKASRRDGDSETKSNASLDL
jgi:hypothetical protein